MQIKEIQELRSLQEGVPAIAGPCSAESLEQVLGCARQLAAQGVRIFRAGIWKPRTRPGCFEGIGEPGLEWMAEVKRDTGMYTTTEVAIPRHAESALKAGIDILWIGARTSANPFAMQDLADCLRGTDIPVLVKNPINPDLELWIGSMERLEKAGICKIAAIHRGFSTYGETVYRYAPQWQLPIELRRRCPELPILCDPSHMAGRRDLVQSLAQKAFDLGADGLMVEVHPNPECAKSDAAQQLTPAQFGAMIQSLKRRSKDIPATAGADLSQFRGGIDLCDSRILETLTERFGIAREIGAYKKEHNMTVLQRDRYNEITESLVAKAETLGISENCIRSIFEAIHSESIRQQLEQFDNN